MPASTPKLALPYPVAADPADVPADLLALATRLDTLEPWYATSLPASPVDGQEVYYAADPANGVIWHLRYRAGATGSYKWEFLGGPPMTKIVATRESLGSSNGVWLDPATVGPQLTIPLAGDYNIEFHVTMETPSLIATANVGVAIGAGNPLIAYPIANGSGNNINLDMNVHTQYAGRAANDQLRLRYMQSANNAAGYWFLNRYLYVTPIRVG